MPEDGQPCSEIGQHSGKDRCNNETGENARDANQISNEDTSGIEKGNVVKVDHHQVTRRRIVFIVPVSVLDIFIYPKERSQKEKLFFSLDQKNIKISRYEHRFHRPPGQEVTRHLSSPSGSSHVSAVHRPPYNPRL